MRFGDFSCTATISWLIFICLLHHSSKRWIKPEASGFGFFFTRVYVMGDDTPFGEKHCGARVGNENLAEVVSVAIMEGFPKSIAHFCARSIAAERNRKTRTVVIAQQKHSKSIVKAEKIYT
jgi:hypothetical protein